MLLFPLTGAYVEPTDGMRQLAQNFRAALAACGLSLKEAADLMKLDESQLVRQLNVRDGQHLSLYRLALLPRKVRQEFVRITAEQLGGEDPFGLLGPALLALSKLAERIPMAQMAIPDERSEKRSA